MFSRSSIVFRFSQAFENARVTVFSSAGIIPGTPRIHRLDLFLSCLARKLRYFLVRLESSPFKVFSTIRSGGNGLLWFIAVLIAAFVAVVLGFTHVAIASIGIAKVLFFLFVLLFLVAVLGHVFRRP